MSFCASPSQPASKWASVCCPWSQRKMTSQEFMPIWKAQMNHRHKSLLESKKLKITPDPWLPLRPHFPPLSPSLNRLQLTPASLLFLKHARHTPASKLLLSPFPLPGMLFHQMAEWVPPSLYLVPHSSIISSGRSSWTTPPKLGPSHSPWHSLFPYPALFPHTTQHH